VPLSDLAIASLGHLGQIAEASLSGVDRPRMGNDLFGAFGRDFVTADGTRLMVVAITPRQWSGLLEVLGLTTEVEALEAKLGVAFGRDEAARFLHRDRLAPLVATAMAARPANELTAAFEARGVTWGPYQPLSVAVARDPYFNAANPVLTEIANPGGRSYLAPGAAATLPQDQRRPASPAPALGRDTEEVLSDVLGLAPAEIRRLRDEGLAA